MKKAVLLYFLLCAQIVFCQNNSIENLNSELKIAKADTVKIKILIKMGDRLMETDPEKALGLYQQALKIALPLNNNKYLALIYLDLGGVNRQLGNYPEELKNHLEALKLSEQLKSKMQISRCYVNISTAYEDMGNYTLALDYGLRAIKLLEELKDKRGTGIAYMNLGSFYTLQKKHEESIKFLNSALKIFREIKDTVQMVIVYDNLSSVHDDLKNFEESKNYATLALNLKKQRNDTLGLAYSYSNLSNIYFSQKKYNEALRYNLAALTLYINSNNRTSTAVTYLSRGNLFVWLADYNRAIIELEKGLRIAKECNMTEQIIYCYGLSSNIYAEKHDYKKAYEYYKLKTTLNDSLYNTVKNKQMVEIQTKYETEKKEEEIGKLTHQSELLKQENKIQQLELSRNWYLILGLGSFVILILIVAFLLAQQNKLKASQTKMEVEQKLFRSQMNPHFIFNSLIAIQNYVYKHEPAEVAKYISSFAKLMRMILENSRNEYVTIEKELDTLKYYLELQQLRFQDKFDFSIEVDPNIDVEAVSIPPMLSQPFIENAIEHGIMNKQDGKGNIVLKFIQKDKMIEMIVEDNGIGIENATKLKAQHEKKHTSLATTITEERLAILNKKSKQKFSLKIIDLKNENGLSRGTQVCINMPEA